MTMKHGEAIFQTVPRIVFGVGSIGSLGAELQRVGAGRVAVITDAGIVGAGIHRLAVDALEKEGLEAAVFEGVEPDPRIDIANQAADFVREQGADAVVGLGGGSSMDIAKAAAVIRTNPDPIETYRGVNLVPKPGLPTVLVPTTAGTGSEVTSIAVLSDTVNKVKVGVVSEHMFARCALLDPALTVKLPPRVTASTGLDALIHAIESYVGRQASFMTEPLALAAIELVAENLRKAYACGEDLDARTGMLRASLLAGMAFANTQTGAAHACALALGGAFHVPHGIATSLMLPAVMRFNSIAVPEKFARIATIFGEKVVGLPPTAAARRAVSAVIALIEDVDFKLGLENYGVTESDIPGLAEASILPAARLWNNNPRSATREQVERIFRDSLAGGIASIREG